MTSGTLERRGARSNNGNNPLALPRRDDIEDLVNQMEEATHLFSQSLLKNPKWKRGLSSEQRELLNNSVNQCRVLCEGMAALLQTFSYFSRRIAAILNRMFEEDCRSDMGRYAGNLQHELERISAQISTVKQQYTNFTSRFQNLVRISPCDSSQCLQNLQKNQEVFQRLDAFWKVVATQLFRREPLSSDISHDAQKWSEYINNCLENAKSRLTLSADALNDSGKPPQKGFIASIFSKLGRRG